ncbi:MAG: DUF1289 domain-containing protein [Tagaea sp.]|nr:DUF1289 domain-containing protein [Tagaea sp.]
MKSPCVKVCRLDGRNICEGCGRSAREIRLWTSYSDEERDAILARLADPRSVTAASSD